MSLCCFGFESSGGATSGVVTGSGTLNFLPKWTPNGTTLGNSQIFDNGTSIGIGTLVPSAKLHVNTTTVSTGVSIFKVSFPLADIFNIDDSYNVNFITNNGLTITGSNGLVNIVSNGGTSPSLVFKFNNGASTSGIIYGNGLSMGIQTPSLGIGAAVFSANTAAILDISSTTQGVLFPRMTTAQKNAIASPVNGLIVYDTDLTGLGLFTASSWKTLSTLTGNETLTNKRITLRVVVTTQSATPSINSDNGDIFSITGLSQAITSFTTNLTGTPTTGQLMSIEITDNGVARALTFGASFGNSGTLSLPTTTVASTLLRCLFQWNGSVWQIVAVV